MTSFKRDLSAAVIQILLALSATKLSTIAIVSRMVRASVLMGTALLPVTVSMDSQGHSAMLKLTVAYHPHASQWGPHVWIWVGENFNVTVPQDTMERSVRLTQICVTQILVI